MSDSGITIKTFFDGVRVGDDAILGDVNDGFKVMVTTLNGGRLFVASLALASLAFALDKVRGYAQERIQFDGKPIGRFQRVQDVIVDMDIALEQSVTWLLHLVRLYDAGTLDEVWPDQTPFGPVPWVNERGLRTDTVPMDAWDR